MWSVLKTKAAIKPPMSGATIKIQTCDKASVLPLKIKDANAVAILLAGLTDVPVKLIPTKWTRVNVKPMIKPGKLPNFALSSVTLRIT